MPASNPTASNASQPPTQDLQQLVGLLGNLMPLLLRLQSQAFPQQAFPQEAYPSQAFDPSLQRGAGFATPNPALDRQASENFISDIIAEQLRTFSAYLEANAGQFTPEVLYLARTPSHYVYLTQGGMTLGFTAASEKGSALRMSFADSRGAV